MNIQAVMASHDLPTFAEGREKERELIRQLFNNSQAPALQHIFFAQRQIAKVPGVDRRKAKKIKSVGIVGCGTMGGGILMCFVQAGIPVVVLETKQMYLEKGLGVVRGNWMRRVKKGKLKKKKFEKYMAMIKPTLDYKDFSEVLFPFFRNKMK